MSETKHINVLIIDDEISIRKLLEFYLKKYFTITTKNDGEEALEWINKGAKPDVIIADLNMPKMDGYKFTEYIRSKQEFEKTPVIILSANESSNDRIKSLRIGADDYMIKPFNPEELYLRIYNILKRVEKI